MTLKIAHFLSMLLFALVMGVFWGTWFTLSRSIEGFQPQTFLDIGQTAIRNLAVPMAILMPLSLLSALIMIARLPKRSIAFVFAIVAFALMVAALVVTLAVEVTIDNQVKVWTIATLPANWEMLRDRWEFYHGVRTFVSIFALAFMTVSGLQINHTNHPRRTLCRRIPPANPVSHGKRPAWRPDVLRTHCADRPNSKDSTCSSVDGSPKERRSADGRDQRCKLLLVMSMSGHLAAVS